MGTLSIKALANLFIRLPFTFELIESCDVVHNHVIGDNQLNHRKSHFWRRKEKRGQSYKEKVSFMIAGPQGMGHRRMTISSLHCNFGITFIR